jgi:hypothetical protein
LVRAVPAGYTLLYVKVCLAEHQELVLSILVLAVVVPAALTIRQTVPPVVLVVAAEVPQAAIWS